MKLVLLASLALAPCLGAQDAIVGPRESNWAEAQRTIFDPAWILPEELWRPSAEQEQQALPLLVPRLIAERFEEPEAPAWAASLGDVVAEARRRGLSPATVKEFLQELAARAPLAHARLAPLLANVLDASGLSRASWDGTKDKANDGLWMQPALALRPTLLLPWKEQRGSRSLQQLCTLVWADLEAFKAAENAYRPWFEDPQGSYESIGPRPDSYLRGTDGPRGPFAALRLDFCCDLPFPFGDYDCELSVLSALDAAGNLNTWIYSPSPDFYWMAGQDWLLPLFDSQQAFQGLFLVRVLGLDLRGVPDDEGNHAEALRFGAGRLKQRSEARFAAHLAEGGAPRTLRGAIPQFELSGPPPKSRK